MASAVEMIRGSFKPEIAEGLAARWAICLALQNGIQALDAESDCLMVIEAFDACRDLSSFR